MPVVKAMLKRDLAVTLRDARAGLADWWLALREVRDNPLYRLLHRTWAKRAPRNVLLRLAGYLPPLFVLGTLGYAIHLWQTYSYNGSWLVPWLLPALMVAIALYIVWLGMGLYHITVDALIFLGRPASRSGNELQLDETLMGVRLNEREILTALLATLVPRVWLRWFSAPLVAHGLYWLSVGWVGGQDRPPYAALSTWWPGVTDVSQAQLTSSAPLTLSLLYLYAVPSAVMILLFLIAMGRSLDHRWQIQLLAASVSVTQLAWIPWSYFQLLSWKFFAGHEPESIARLAASALFPIISLGLLVAALHFTRRVPWARLAISVALPLINGSMFYVAYEHFASVRQSLWQKWWHYLFTWSWVSSSYSLYNPLALPFGLVSGVSPQATWTFRQIEWYRGPTICLVQLCAVVICAHAARLAIQDLRKSEE